MCMSRLFGVSEVFGNGAWEWNMSRYTRYVCIFKIRWGSYDDNNNDNNLNDWNDDKRCTRVVVKT